MENPRPEKVAVVNEVRERLSSSGAAILTEYRGLNVSELAALRRSLREAGGQYKIYKNTLVRFAVRELGLELEEMLLGPTAIAFVDGDAASVAKSLRDFARGNPNLVIKGGVLGETILSAKDASALAELPSKEQLLAQLAGAMAAPLQQMAGLLKALPQNFAYALRAVAEQQGGPVDLDSPPEPETSEAEAEPEPEAQAVSIPDHPGVSPAPDETENPPDFEGESPPSDVELPESPAPDETATPPSDSEDQGEQ